ncbi:PREDICTED: uncharacterized protein LOC108559392 isoform X1 [Nicrophorus vespilloides]|uniref:Uncharacterized protein LOC108559392 isoform X1 n=1 Tax=Nicrophorus vespilloides TaxID=110193 RepID=A0ABM1MC50_NICVS|nr:PREDICTED: uncharacterized protein LOC108559392 isoform X1 [Nicrophorus vespilloides]
MRRICILVVLVMLGWSSAAVARRRDVVPAFVALDTALSYFLENHDSINIDGLFGVVFGQAHLQSLLADDLSNYDRKLVKYLKHKADTIYYSAKPRLYNPDNFKHNLFVEKILVPDLWTRDIRYRHLPEKFVPEIEFDSASEYMDYLSTSNISETKSDSCLIELISGPNSVPHNCSVSEDCKDYMVDNDYFDPTYGITHRLLYLQLARSQKCSLDGRLYEERTSAYCSYIYWEIKQNRRFGFMQELDDLLLEQITLCGFEGYDNFFEDSLVSHVLQIQTPFGCFRIPEALFETNGDDLKRTANIIKHGCNDHTTGLGISTLSLILRYLLK